MTAPYVHDVPDPTKPGHVMPQPWIELDGVRVYCRADHWINTVTALDGLRIDWGREELFGTHQPARASFTLWDPLGFWLERALVTKDVIGVKVVVGWTWEGDSRIIFRGRVSNMDAELGRPVGQRTTQRGFDVHVVATSVEADGGNIKYDETFPTESAIVRANRIKFGAVPLGIEEYYFAPSAVDLTLSVVDVTDKSLTDLADSFYITFGCAWDYRPEQNVVRVVPRYADAPMCSMATLPGTLDVVLIHGVFTETGFYDDTTTYYGTFLRGCDVTVTGSTLELNRSQRINKMLMHRTDEAGQATTRVEDIAGGDVPRLLEFTTWMDGGNINVPTDLEGLWVLWNTARNEATIPQHPDIEWDTKRSGGFYGVEQAFALTRCTEAQNNIRVTGDPFAQAIGALGDIRLLGGAAEWRDRRWIVTMRPKWPGSQQKTVNIWSHLVGSDVTWNDPAAGRFDESVTWADMEDIYGLGRTVGELQTTW